MATMILKEYKVSFKDSRPLFLYSTEDLRDLDLLMRSTTMIEATGRAGLGTNGINTYDGATDKIEAPKACSVRVRPTRRITSKTPIGDTDAILAEHRDYYRK